VPINKKIERREESRERRAEEVARIDNAIKTQLLQRLQQVLPLPSSSLFLLVVTVAVYRYCCLCPCVYDCVSV
jgi:hypothetical protein